MVYSPGFRRHFQVRDICYLCNVRVRILSTPWYRLRVLVGYWDHEDWRELWVLPSSLTY